MPQPEQPQSEKEAPAQDGQSCDLTPFAERAANIAQAKALREQAAKGGLAFEAYLPPQQALWFLSLIEAGKYSDPGDALFNLLGEAQDLAPHADLRKELLRRSLDAALMPGPAVPIEACLPDVNTGAAQAEPAVWQDYAPPTEAAKPAAPTEGE